MSNFGTGVVLVVLFAGVAAPSAPAASGRCEQQTNVDKLRTAAAKGDANAMFQLGCATKDPAQAAAWFRKAADAGSVEGMVYLGILYENVGFGVPHDEAQAAAWYRRAADLGDASAMYHLGLLFWQGRGVAQDVVEAYKWLDLAAVYENGETQKRSADARDAVAKKMPPYLIADARKRVSEWQASFMARKK